MKKVNHPKSKRFNELTKQIDSEKLYDIKEAIKLIKKTSNVKFDASVEAHIRLNIDPKKGEQQVRSSVALPYGNGKNVRVAVICADSAKQKSAKEAGADIVGEQDLIENIKKGVIDFDILVATPSAMKLLGPVAKILGPKGIMPNPKDGTVTDNIADTVTNLKKGQINYKNDDSGNLHVIVGKVSFEDGQLDKNYDALIESVQKAKPAPVKGGYIKNVALTSSMGPSVKIKFE
ncbi:MAG TPA: 50S ribosomal protein L1 [Patescibacteria group bacterium]|nr:50S ribosomal protein L1 [Patescibacteria group bacterium]